jgi:hypothetical protein
LVFMAWLAPAISLKKGDSWTLSKIGKKSAKPDERKKLDLDEFAFIATLSAALDIAKFFLSKLEAFSRVTSTYFQSLSKF